MLLVARPKKQERSERRSRTYRLPEDLLTAFEMLAEHNRRPVTTELEIAIEAHLTRAKRWPPEPHEG